MIRKFIYIFLTVIGATCSPVEKEASPDQYFDMTGLMNHQLNQAIALDAELVKYIDMAEKSDTSAVRHSNDTANWEDELDAFYELNINQPRLQGMYDVSERKDDNSNLMIREYTFTGEEGKVPSVSVWYLDSIQSPVRIRARYRDSNVGFHSTRTYTMFWEDRQGKLLMDSFRIEGGQKVVGQDTMMYSVSGKFRYGGNP